MGKKSKQTKGETAQAIGGAATVVGRGKAGVVEKAKMKKPPAEKIAARNERRLPKKARKKIDRHKAAKRREMRAAWGNATTTAAPVQTAAEPVKVSISYNNKFRALRKNWPADMKSLFSPATSDETRAKLLDLVAEQGSDLMGKFAWAIPDERALTIIRHFAPIVEIGAGNGYWAYLLKKADTDILAYDIQAGIEETVSGSDEEAAAKKAKKAARKRKKGGERKTWTAVKKGGPEVLQLQKNKSRTLLLCYPDEYELSDSSLGLECLTVFTGDIVIHVGELYADTISTAQAPWGRTSGPDFQEALAKQFHCILKVGLLSWPISRDSLSVWKRTQTVTVAYEGSSGSDDEDDGADRSTEDAKWGFVPPDEMLPLDMAAPCVAHLLLHPPGYVGAAQSTSAPPKLTPAPTAEEE